MKVQDFMHRASRHVVDWCVQNNIDTVVIGKNNGWKQNINIGKKNNQTFVQIPFNSFIEKLKYKLEEYGIHLLVSEESYTSKASFLDNDIIPQITVNNIDYKLSGKRIKRGMYVSATGIRINADVNGSYNIIRKVFPEAFRNGIEGVVLHPIRRNIA